MPPKTTTKRTPKTTKVVKRVEPEQDESDTEVVEQDVQVADSGRQESRRWQDETGEDCVSNSGSDNHISEDEEVVAAVAASGLVSSERTEESKPVSVTDFDMDEFRATHLTRFRDVDLVVLLKSLIVLGYDQKNPALWAGARRLLQQLCCEHIPRTERTEKPRGKRNERNERNERNDRKPYRNGPRDQDGQTRDFRDEPQQSLSQPQSQPLSQPQSQPRGNQSQTSGPRGQQDSRRFDDSRQSQTRSFRDEPREQVDGQSRNFRDEPRDYDSGSRRPYQDRRPKVSRT